MELASTNRRIRWWAIPASRTAVHAHADHGGLVHDRVDAGQGRIHGGRLAYVANVDRHAVDLVDGCGARAVRRRVQAVEDAHVVPGIGERRYDVCADESRAAGDQNSHGGEPRVPGERSGVAVRDL
jgi:hypothetical protein